nr:extracellular solute-binding protein [Anaerofilum sp. An201]
MNKRWVCAMMAFFLGMQGCTQPVQEQPLSEPETAPMQISVAFWNIADYLAGDSLQKYIEDKFHVQFVPVNITYDNYPSKYQEMAVADELPDIFAHDIMGTSVYEAWIQDGKISALPSNLSEYPNLEAYLETPYNQRFRTENGKIYAIPRMTYPSEELWALDRCILLRKDWMETLGLEEPQSWEEFVHLLQAFVNEDPDQNGVNDTGGLTSVHLNVLEAVYLSIFPELSNTERGWLYENERWMPVWASSRTGAALDQMQRLYRDGLLAPDFAYVTQKKAKEDFSQGRVGAIACQYYAMLKHLASEGELEKAQDMILVMRPWPAEDGNRYRFTTSLHWSETYFGGNVNRDKMERILQIYDWLLSDEFERIYRYGLEGTDWVWKGNEVQPLDETGNTVLLNKYPSLNIFGYLADWNQQDQYEDTSANALLFGKENVQYARELLRWYSENTVRVNYNYDIIFMSTPSKNRLISNRDVQREMVRAIMSHEQASLAWERSMQQFYADTTLQEAIDEVTAKAKEKKIVG